VARPSGKIVFLVAGGLFALIGLDLAIGSIQLYTREVAFQHALVTEGIVSDKNSHNTASTTNSSRSLSVYELSANYKVGRQWFRIDQQSVPSDLYLSVHSGSPIQIFYRASDPSDGVITKPSRQWLVGLFGVPMFIVGAIAFIIGLRGAAP